MAKERSDKSKYPSRYSPGGWVTEAQYIVELVCERYARSKKKDLPMKFWKDSEWEKYYVSQLRATHALLKKYDGKVIIDTIKTSRMWSLRPKWVKETIALAQIKHEALKLQAQAENKKKNPPQKPIIGIPTKRRHKSRLSSLLDFEKGMSNGEEENSGEN